MPMAEEHESHLSYMKIFNAGEKLIVNRHEGNLQSRIVYWWVATCLFSAVFLSSKGQYFGNLVRKGIILKNLIFLDIPVVCPQLFYYRLFILLFSSVPFYRFFSSSKFVQSNGNDSYPTSLCLQIIEPFKRCLFFFRCEGYCLKIFIK